LIGVYVTSGNDTEQLLTLEAMVQVSNAFTDAATSDGDAVDMRHVLDDAGFPRAVIAPEAAIRRTAERFADLRPRFQSLPDVDVETATLWTNAELTELAISPSLTAHGGAALHIHWTPASATFDDQVIADFLMALANELCDNGTTRFGRCAADDCERLFYDSSRNGSRRFCSDPRCASRTHTADHRKRKNTTKKHKT
jgi:hypothetical protein